MLFPKKCLSIDIGNDQIKIADVVRSGETVKIIDYAIIGTPKDCLNDGMVINKTALSDAIKGAIKENKLKTKEIIFTIASSKIITREVNFPILKPKKLKTIIDMNASEYFPVNLNDYTLDFTVIETVEVDGEKSLKVNIIAALSELIEDYVAVADLANLKIAGIDYAGNSMINFAKREKLEGTNIILDMGSESTMVSIVSDGVMKFNRNLLYGSRLLLDCIKKHFEVDYEEAIRISNERPLLNINANDNPYLSNDVTGAMNQILNGISRLIDYYTSRNDANFRSIYIVGGGANICEIEEYIENFFNIRTKTISPFKSGVYKGNKDFSIVEINFANVIGACFSNISLVPKSLLERTKKQTQKRTGFLFALLLIISVAMIIYFKIADINRLEDRKEKLLSDIEAAKAIDTIKNEYDMINNKATFRQQIMDASTSTTEQFNAVLEVMEETMPNEVFYLNMVNTEEEITINCIARDKMTVAKFIETLKQSGFSSVYVPGISTIGDGEDEDSFVSFSITCKY